ncbi:hypothetical protein R6Q59_008625 [Mikania micrantha]
MENSNKETKLKSTEEINLKMRRSLSWDRAFFTSDGFLAPEELSNMIEGGGGDVRHELQKIEELESMEFKLFQQIETSTQILTRASVITNSSFDSSSGKRVSQAKKVSGAGGPHKDAPVKTPPPRTSQLSGGSGGSLGNNVKTLAKRSTSSINGKANADSPSIAPSAITTKSKIGLVNTRTSRTSPASPGSPGSKNGKANVVSPLKTPPGITTKNKMGSVGTRVARTSPASPVSPGSSGSSSSKSSVNQQSKWNDSVTCRSSVNNEKPSATNGRRYDEWKSSKPAVDLMSKSQSSISLKIKPPPVMANPSSPSELFNSSDQRPKSRVIKGSTVHHTAKPTSRKHLTGQTSVTNGKQPATTSRTGSIKTVATHNTGLKPNSLKAKTKKQSSGKENIIIISPEILDLKGKINALKMEISMQKDRCNKTVRAESGKANFKTSFAMEECSL